MCGGKFNKAMKKLSYRLPAKPAQQTTHQAFIGETQGKSNGEIMPRCIGGYQGLHRRVVVTEQLTPCNVEGLAHEVYMADSREAPGGSSSYDLLWCLRHYPCGIAQQAGLLVQHGATSKFRSAELKINCLVLTYHHMWISV